MQPYKVIGKYIPGVRLPGETRQQRATRIGKYLTKFTASLELLPHIDPEHGPIVLSKSWYDKLLHAEVRSVTKDSTAEDWHYDGDTTDGANPKCYMVLWASNHPTLIRVNSSGEVFQLKPYEIVLIDNMAVQHRRPSGCPKYRSLFRQRVTPKPSLLE